MRVDAYNFPRVAKIMQAIDEEALKDLEGRGVKLSNRVQKLEEQVASLQRIEKNFVDEIRRTTRGKSSLQSLEDQRADLQPFTNTFSQNFVLVVLDLARGLRQAWGNIQEWTDDLRPRELMLIPEDEGAEQSSYEKLQQRAAEFQLNQGVADDFTTACIEIGSGQRSLVGMMDTIIRLLDGYFARLQRRHSQDGIKVHVSPIVT
ncbi:unnamed protein product, partial [marine sediment metagenome]